MTIEIPKSTQEILDAMNGGMQNTQKNDTNSREPPLEIAECRPWWILGAMGTLALFWTLGALNKNVKKRK